MFPLRRNTIEFFSLIFEQEAGRSGKLLRQSRSRESIQWSALHSMICEGVSAGYSPVFCLNGKNKKQEGKEQHGKRSIF